jgi:hypothetical protein
MRYAVTAVHAVQLGRGVRIVERFAVTDAFVVWSHAFSCRNTNALFVPQVSFLAEATDDAFLDVDEGGAWVFACGLLDRAAFAVSLVLFALRSRYLFINRHRQRLDNILVWLWHWEDVNFVTIWHRHWERMEDVAVGRWHWKNVDHAILGNRHWQRLNDVLLRDWEWKNVDRVTVWYRHWERLDDFLIWHGHRQWLEAGAHLLWQLAAILCDSHVSRLALATWQADPRAFRIRGIAGGVATLTLAPFLIIAAHCWWHGFHLVILCGAFRSRHAEVLFVPQITLLAKASNDTFLGVHAGLRIFAGGLLDRAAHIQDLVFRA